MHLGKIIYFLHKKYLKKPKSTFRFLRVYITYSLTLYQIEKIQRKSLEPIKQKQTH